MRRHPGLTVLLALGALLTGCATAPAHYPSATATQYVGKSLLDLEMHWSTPYDLAPEGTGQAATWRFDQYNLAGCKVTVHSDAAGIIRNVSWTRGCGPKGTGTAPAEDPGSP